MDESWHTVEVTVPGHYPDDGEFLQAPIEDVLHDAGVLFAWLDFGTFIPVGVVACGFAMEISDLKRGVSILAQALKDAEVPPSTTIRIAHPQGKTFTLGEMA